MKAAEGTIKFFKQFIDGTLGHRRQYMHYYVVDGPNAQFLMKNNYECSLEAVKDHNGHIYIFDNRAEIEYDRNPFFVLITQDYKYNFSFINTNSFQQSRHTENISKWKTLDTIFIKNNTRKDLNIAISLIEIGEHLFIMDNDHVTSINVLNLKEWANYDDLKTINMNDKKVFTCPLRHLERKISRVEQMRGDFRDFAGDAADGVSSKVLGDWIAINTTFTETKELIGTEGKNALLTRPSPLNYNLNNQIVSTENAWLRLESFDTSKVEFDRYGPPTHPQFLNLKNFFKGHILLNNPNWREDLKTYEEKELAENFINYIEDDNRWLEKNRKEVAPIILGEILKKQLLDNRHFGTVILKEEVNPSVLDSHVIYVKGKSEKNVPSLMNRFLKLIPAPHSDFLFKVKEFKNVCI